MPHFAFQTTPEGVDRNAERLRGLGIPVAGPFRHLNVEVVSIYFQTPQGHKTEICTWDGYPDEKAGLMGAEGLTPAASEPSYPIRSVDTALELLLLFANRREISVSQAADLLNVARSTAHRMLSMLAHRDFVRQDERSKFYIFSWRSSRAVSRSVPHGASARFCPPIARPGGKATLAEMDETALDAHFNDTEFVALSENSIVDPEPLKAELAAIRSRGWASNDEESEAGLRAVAVAIPAGDRLVMPAAITVAGPTFRMSDERMQQIAAALTATLEQSPSTARPSVSRPQHNSEADS